MDSFWQGKKVLVTGHTGFKGSWISLWLQQVGAEVVGFALAPPTEPSLFEGAGVERGMTSIVGDIRDLAQLCAVVEEHRPEIVLHLAAQAIVRQGYDDPIETFSSNVMGTVNVLEAIRRHPSARSVVIVTTDKCYENLEVERGYREDSDALGGRDPYSSSKACAELVTRAYRDSFFVESALANSVVGVATARAGNVIGGGDWARDRLIPDLMRAVLDDQPLLIRSPNAVRPWQHVLEPVSGYLKLAELLFEQPSNFAEAWNFAPGDQELLSVRAIVERLEQQWDGPVDVRIDAGPHPHEHTLLQLDPEKAGRRLDWRPRLDADGALRWVVDWYREFRDQGNLRAVTEQQIESYRKLIDQAS